MDKHAQYEIRQYAGVLATMAKAVAPVAYEVFEEYSLYATTMLRSVRDHLVKLIGPMVSTSPEAAEILKSIEDEK